MTHTINNRPASYILSMSCVSGDEVQVAIHRREDVDKWLAKLDHEGSSWSVTQHHWRGDLIIRTDDITEQWQC